MPRYSTVYRVANQGEMRVTNLRNLQCLLAKQLTLTRIDVIELACVFVSVVDFSGMEHFDDVGTPKTPLGCLSMGALQIVMLVWGAARFFGIFSFLNWWSGAEFWPGLIGAVVLCEVPLVGHVLAVAGGVVAYGLRWYWSLLLFAPEAVYFVIVFPIVAIYTIVRTKR